MQKYSNYLLVTGMLFLSACATPNAVKKDSKVAWKGTKQASGEVWEGTKQASGEVWKGTKRAVNNATAD